MIRIIIADDHRIFIDGLQSVLDAQQDIKVVAIASNGKELLDILKKTETDIVLMDINMPELNGIDATSMIRKLYPKIKVLVLSMYKTKEFASALSRAGAAGYLLKNTGLSDLLDAIKAVHKGESFGLNQLPAQDKKQFDPDSENFSLSKREAEIIRHLAQGMTAPQIGEKLFISHYTVETHRKNLLNKLQLKNTAELIKYAAQLGLLDE